MRITTSGKDKQTGEYFTDFSSYVSFLGTSAASKAMRLKEKDRIKLGNTDVRTRYDKDKNVTYYNFSVFSFETAEEVGNEKGRTSSNSLAEDEGGFVEEGDSDEDTLPF